MRNLTFYLILSILVIACTPQQSYQQDTMRYFELNGTEKQYSDAIDQMFDLLKQQYSAQNVPDTVWEELQGEKDSALVDIKSQLVSAYRSNFSHDDIKELTSFYDSETGRQMVEDGSKLTESQKKEISDFLSSDIGKRVQNQSESLTIKVGEVSQVWSGSLYNEMTEKLKVKGFKKPY